MKNIKYSILIAVTLLTVAISSCTKNFEDYNTNPNGITDEELAVDFRSIGAFYASMQNPYSSAIPLEVGDMGMGGTWAGYFMLIYPGPESVNYYLFGGQYSLFNEGYNNIMAPVNEVKRRGARETAPDFWAVALTLKVHNMQRVTDIYGPITYSEYGKGGVTASYDSQEKVYDTFFAELDTAVTNFKTYIATNPGAKPFAKFDKVYGGDYTKWLKFANSTRLRLALQIVKVAPEKARLQAEKAMDPENGGVFTAVSDGAIGGLSGLWVPTHEWGDYRMGATIITYMNGYNDARREGMFELSTVSPGKYLGIRQGATGIIRDNYLGFSDVSLTNFTNKSRYEFMNAAEVYFLRAEGALRGWDMGGSAQELYETGIRTSFTQWGFGGAADAYINDATSKPEDYVDPVIGENSMNALSDVTIKWDEGASNERKLEKIVVQKYIAMFPDGTNVWSTYRRTGYPKQFPVVINNSGGDIDPIIQIRRMIYPDGEVTTNPTEIAKAIQLLGGPDKGSTRLWWDINQPNF
ncbi:MAG: SusD/RagB family nutrient-binding outer membrane lipoprotein [Sphingobacteriales bacterium]|nr:MAG: SusD/RagB family nutrient-binding outer membrane lipoprotein [Sphingobacteriales bacterium]